MNLRYCRDKERIEGLNESLLFGKEAAKGCSWHSGILVLYWIRTFWFPSRICSQYSPYRDANLHTGNWHLGILTAFILLCFSFTLSSISFLAFPYNLYSFFSSFFFCSLSLLLKYSLLFIPFFFFVFYACFFLINFYLCTFPRLYSFFLLLFSYFLLSLFRSFSLYYIVFSSFLFTSICYRRAVIFHLFLFSYVFILLAPFLQCDPSTYGIQSRDSHDIRNVATSCEVADVPY